MTYTKRDSVQNRVVANVPRDRHLTEDKMAQSMVIPALWIIAYIAIIVHGLMIGGQRARTIAVSTRTAQVIHRQALKLNGTTKSSDRSRFEPNRWSVGGSERVPNGRE